MPVRDTLGLPQVYPERPDRDAQGRFIPGHRYLAPNPAATVKRLRSDAQGLLVGHFARNQDRILARLAEKNPERYMELVMQAANEADNRAVPDLDPGAEPPVDLVGPSQAAAARRAEDEAHEARARAHRREQDEARWDDWRVNREADLHNWALDEEALDDEGEDAEAGKA